MQTLFHFKKYKPHYKFYALLTLFHWIISEIFKNFNIKRFKITRLTCKVEIADKLYT
jgi:hypothetical protein